MKTLHSMGSQRKRRLGVPTSLQFPLGIKTNHPDPASGSRPPSAKSACSNFKFKSLALALQVALLQSIKDKMKASFRKASIWNLNGTVCLEAFSKVCAA